MMLTKRQIFDLNDKLNGNMEDIGMGMDLYIVKHHDSFNWNGWRYLINKLNEWDFDTTPMSTMNDGDRLSARWCKAVSIEIMENIDSVEDDSREWMITHAKMFKEAGEHSGLMQY